MKQISNVSPSFDNIGQEMYNLSQSTADQLRKDPPNLDDCRTPSAEQSLLVENLGNEEDYEELVELTETYMDEVFEETVIAGETTLIKDQPAALGLIDLYSEHSDLVAVNDVNSIRDLCAGAAIAEGFQNAFVSNYSKGSNLLEINSFRQENPSERFENNEITLYDPERSLADKTTIDRSTECLVDHISGYIGKLASEKVADELIITRENGDREISRDEILRADDALEAELRKTLREIILDIKPSVGTDRYVNEIEDLAEGDIYAKEEIISRMDVKPSEFSHIRELEEYEVDEEDILKIGRWDLEVPDSIRNFKVNESLINGYEAKSWDYGGEVYPDT